MEEDTRLSRRELLAEIRLLKDELNQTEQKKNELSKLVETLIQEEKKYKNVFNSFPLPYQTLNEEGVILDINPAWLKLLDYNREEVIGKFIGDFIHPKYKSVLKENFALFINQGHIENVEYIVKDKNGSDIFILNDGYIDKRSDGSFMQTHCVFHDIRNVKETEKKLLTKESEFQKIFDYANDAIFIGNSNGDFLNSNPAATLISGYSREEFLNMNMEDLFSESTMKEKPLQYDLFDAGNNVVQQRWLKQKNGNSIPVEMSSNKMPDGKYISIIRDESKRQEFEKELIQSEERYRSIIENSFEGISLINNQQIFTYCNDNLAKILGYSPKEIIGSNFNKYLTKDSLEFVTQRFHNRLRGQKIPSHYSFSIIRKDGEVRHVENSASMYYDKNGNPFTIAQIKDITEELEQERKLQESETRFRSMIENSFEGIGLIDSNFKLKYVNQRLCEITGKPKEIMINSDFRDFLTPESLDLVAERYKRRQAGEYVPNKYEFTAFRTDGSIRSLELASSIITTIESGIQTLIQVNDITERKENEEKLRKSEAKFKALFNDLSDAVFVHLYSKEGFSNFVEVNEVACLRYGYSREEFLQLSPVNITTNIDVKKKGGIKSRRKLYEDKWQTFETIHLKRDGSRFPVEISSRLFNFDNQIMIMSIAHDITERKESEEKLRKSEAKFKSLFNGISDALFVFPYTEKGYSKFIEVNDFATKLYGYSQEELLSLSPIELSSPATNKKQGEGKERREIYENKWITFESEHIKKNGEIFLVEIRSKIYQLDNQKVIMSVVRDITSRKQAEEKLKQSEERFKELSSLTFEGIIIHENGKAIDINMAMEEISGYSREEILSNNIIEMFVVEEDKPLAYNNMKSNYAMPYEVRGIHKDGHIVLAEIESRNVQIEDKKLRVTAIRDVTERQKAKEALDKSNQKLKVSEKTFRAIFNNTLTAIYVQNKDGTFIDVNEGALKMYGYNKEELIGKSPALISAEGKNDLDQVVKYLELAYNEEPQQFEFWGKRKNGEVFPKIVWQSSGTYFGQKVIFAYAMDISKSKKREVIQEVLYNISKAGATSNMVELIQHIQDEIGRIFDTSNFYVAIYNKEEDSFSFPYYSDKNDKFTKAPADKTLGKYVITTQKPLLATLEDKKRMESQGLLVRQGSLSKVWMGAPLRVDSETMGVIAVQSYNNKKAFDEEDLKIFSFVSDQIAQSIHRKKTEEGLAIALQKAKESDRLKSAFLANMSHEIRTPMNGILGFSNILKDATLSSQEQQQYVSIIEKSGKRLLNIINDLIDISKIEAGQVKTTISPVDVIAEIKELFTFFELETTQKKLNLSLQIPSKHELIIKTDPDKFSAVLINLIKNAIKYTLEGSIEIGIKTEENQLRFYVKDTGIGIPKDRLKAVFDRFVQADIEDRDVYEGAGLGLAISKAYIDMLGGEISVESLVGKGSTFYFTLPVDEEVRKSLDQMKKKEEQTKRKRVEGLKVLIADDEEFSYEYLNIVLRKSTREIIRTKTGIETVEVCEQNPDIDLILMDIRMPKMNGYEATKSIRKFNKEVIIVAQTAHALAGDREKAIQAGCNDYIAKPVKRDLLMEIISRYL